MQLKRGADAQASKWTSRFNLVSKYWRSDFGARTYVIQHSAFVVASHRIPTLAASGPGIWSGVPG